MPAREGSFVSASTRETFALLSGPEREYPSGGTSRLPSRAWKKYFRDHAKRRDPFPISGIFATGGRRKNRVVHAGASSKKGSNPPHSQPGCRSENPLTPAAGN